LRGSGERVKQIQKLPSGGISFPLLAAEGISVAVLAIDPSICIPLQQWPYREFGAVPSRTAGECDKGQCAGAIRFAQGGTLVMRGIEFGAAGLVLLFGLGLLVGYIAAERVTCF
jgi:hypothetical protein